MPKSPKRLLLIELNEVNFDVAKTYVDKLGLAAFGRLLSGRSILTSAEANYEELEPWIQWPSVHSGLSSAEHGIFRLGDMVGSGVPQIFEQLEQQGLRVGCISPMNAENRLRAPAYFVPDPWTQTSSDGSWWSRSLGAAIAQAVNDNWPDVSAKGKSVTEALCELLRAPSLLDWLDTYGVKSKDERAMIQRMHDILLDAAADDDLLDSP